MSLGSKLAAIIFGLERLVMGTALFAKRPSPKVDEGGDAGVKPDLPESPSVIPFRLPNARGVAGEAGDGRNHPVGTEAAANPFLPKFEGPLASNEAGRGASRARAPSGDVAILSSAGGEDPNLEL